MSARILDAVDGIIVVEISGTISPAGLAACQAEILSQLEAWGGGSLLCICEEFDAWTKGDWSDLSFQEKADHLIHRMAIIGLAQWEELAMAFVGSGIRPFPIAYFRTGRLIEARAWLAVRD